MGLGEAEGLGIGLPLGFEDGDGFADGVALADGAVLGVGPPLGLVDGLVEGDALGVAPIGLGAETKLAEPPPPPHAANSVAAALISTKKERNLTASYVERGAHSLVRGVTWANDVAWARRRT